MIRRSVSNLAFLSQSPESVGPLLKRHGIEAVELAPTSIWPTFPDVSSEMLGTYLEGWIQEGIVVSGVQSLLFGHPEFQVFDRFSWPGMLDHLCRVIASASLLGAEVAVFGSPKNRVRGNLGRHDADQMFAEFLAGLLPVLEDSQVVLTLEPNAPEYGADYLNTYAEVVKVSDMVDSPWVKPQIDTGCLAMIGEDPARAVRSRTPTHVHVSAPLLGPPPGGIDHGAVNRELNSSGYEGWVVLEMLQLSSSSKSDFSRHLSWLSETYRLVG